jgi:hypothetical protein
MGSANTTSLFPSTITKLGSAIDLDSSEVRGVLGFEHGGTNADSLSGAQSALGIGAIGTLGSPVPILSGGTGASSASAARVNLDLEIDVDVASYPPLSAFSNNGSAFYLNRSNHTGTQSVSTITGLSDYATLETVVPVVSGGTGAATASAARVNLDLEIDVDVASYPPLSAFSINGPSYFLSRVNHTGTQNVSTVTGLGDFSTLLTVVPVVSGGTGANTASAARVNLDLEIGVDVQAYSVELSAVDALNTTGVVVRTGPGSVVTRTLSGGTGVTITDGDGIATNPLIEIGQNVSTSASPSFSGVYSTGLDKRSYVLLLSATTLTYENNVVYLDGTFDVQLPPVIDQAVLTLKNVGSGVVQIIADESDSIDGLSSLSLSSQYDHTTLHGCGSLSAWFILG